MTAYTTTCKSCNAQITGEIFHLGFADMQALYCSSCPRVLLLKNRYLLEQAGIFWPHLQAGENGWQTWDRHLLPIYEKVENLFLPCSCGGTFRYINPPRCPECRGLLQGEIYEDKPILKERDAYVFVSMGSIDDINAFKASLAE